MQPEFLPTTPEPIAADTWLIPTLAADPAGGYLGAHSAVIRGEEPVVLDTSVLFGRDRWLQNVFSIVEPEDVRWIFLSHDDHDHLGNLDVLLDLCPNATLLANYAMTGRLFGDVELPLERMRWINVGESIDIGDRELVHGPTADVRLPRHPRAVRHQHRHALGGRQLRRLVPGRGVRRRRHPGRGLRPELRAAQPPQHAVDGVGRPGAVRRARGDDRVAAPHRGGECARSRPPR